MDITRTRSVRQCLSFLCAFSLVGSTLAADTPVASDPIFSASRIDGSTISGRLRQFGLGGEIILVSADGREKEIPAGELVKLVRVGPAQLLTPEPSVVLFPEGDRLYRSAIGGATETTLEVQSYSIDGKLAVPLEAILGVVFAQPNDREAIDAQVTKLRTERRTSEVLWLANKDRITGSLLTLTDKGLGFQSGKTELQLDRSAVISLGLDPSLVVYPKPKGVFFELTLADGSRLGVTEPKLDQGHLVATSRFGVRIRVKLGELTRVYPRMDSLVYLSDRPQAGVVYESYIGLPRPYRRDATVDGHSFRLSGQDYDRGIGTESRTMLAFRLDPGDKRFQAQVGLDDRAGPLGSVVFRVLVDRVEKYRSPPMSVRDVPRSIDLDVAGAKSLVLLSEFGDRGGVRDLADWVEARLIR